MAPSNTAVTPFKCRSCGALLPLGDGRSVRCPFCNGETRVPAEYEATQRAAKGFAADTQLAAQLYGRVGKPPGRFARAVGRGAEGATNIGAAVGAIVLGLAADQPIIGVLMLMAAAYAFGFPVAALVRLSFWVLRKAPPGPLSPFPILAAATVLVVFGFGIPIVLRGKERALAGVRADIHASLAAALPERPGGPSRCRSCGAALDVPKGALGVPCAYCRADNLVALPADWVARVRATEFTRFLQIDSALEAFRRASENATEQLWKLGLAMVLVFPLVMLVAWLLDAAAITF